MIKKSIFLGIVFTLVFLVLLSLVSGYNSNSFNWLEEPSSRVV